MRFEGRRRSVLNRQMGGMPGAGYGPFPDGQMGVMQGAGYGPFPDQYDPRGTPPMFERSPMPDGYYAAGMSVGDQYNGYQDYQMPGGAGDGLQRRGSYQPDQYGQQYQFRWPREVPRRLHRPN